SGTINGTTYTVTDTQTTSGGDEIFQVVVAGSSNYTFYEYTHYTPGTQSAEMFAYTSLTDAQAGLGNNEFFTLTMGADGTYDFHLVSNSLQTFAPVAFSGVNSGTGDFAYINNGLDTFGPSNGPDPTPTPTPLNMTTNQIFVDGYKGGFDNQVDGTVHVNQ